MNISRLISCAIVFGYLLCSGYALAETGKVLTEEDLKGYKKTSDFEIQKEKKASVSGAGKEASRKAGKGNDQEYYCKKGNEYRRKIEEARHEQDISKKRLEELKNTGASTKRINREENSLDKKEKALSRAEHDLRDFENEAHRKNIPPGWLRCQF